MKFQDDESLASAMTALQVALLCWWIWGRGAARSVVTSCGRLRACSIVVQNVVADAMSRRFETYTSITWPCWSTAG